MIFSVINEAIELSKAHFFNSENRLILCTYCLQLH